MKYTLIPKGSQYTYWSGRHMEDFVPNYRQKMLMDVYRDAAEADLFYTSDVLAFAIEKLGVTPDVAAIGADKVEGGDLGMDMYYARDAVDLINKRANLKEDFSKISPTVGKKFGSLSINYKRTNVCVITELSGNRITIAGKRGSKYVSFDADASQIITSVENAYEFGWRKSPTV